MSANLSIQKTALHSLHSQLGGKLVAFSGWELPIQYQDGIIAEHKHCRNAAALFDVSHMTQGFISADHQDKLEQLLPTDLAGLETGKARYSFFTNMAGGIIDDLIISRIEGGFYIVMNAARRSEDLAHLSAHDVTIQLLDGKALIALQGPKAGAVFGKLCPDALHLRFMETGLYTWNGQEIRASRLGYTGEDGFEISIDNSAAVDLAKALLADPDCAPAGLGARDSLRLEAGLCLYGNDILETTSPIEAGLIWAIPKSRRQSGGFLGDAHIIDHIQNGADRKFTGIKPLGRAPARQGTEVFNQEGQKIGEITSGGFGPTYEGPIAMGYISANHSDSNVILKIRGKDHPAELTKLPFVKQNYHR